MLLVFTPFQLPTKNHNCLLTLSLLGPPGIGKTSSIARLALKWVEGAKQLRAFDFVFAIQLKYAHKASSLAELIKLQHDRLKVSECFTFAQLDFT